MRGPLSGKTLRLMPWNNDLRADVEEQLAWEPDIDATARSVGRLDVVDEIEIVCRPAGWSIMRERSQQKTPKERWREAPMIIGPRRVVQLIRLAWKRRPT